MISRLTLALLLFVAAAGCSTQQAAPTQPAPAPQLQLTPADGATDVRLDAPLTLDLGVAVTTGDVESGLHLIGEADMTGECPDTSMAAHGTMDAIMGDPAAMAHMDAVHATRGSFSWSDGDRVCTFTPDSMMRPQTRYMVHLGGPMLRMMRDRGGAMGPGMMTGSGDMVLHFRTMSADGHSGHH